MTSYTYLELTRLNGALEEFHLVIDLEPREEANPSGAVELVKWFPDVPDPQLSPDSLDQFLEQEDNETLNECIHRVFDQRIAPLITIPEYKQ